MQLTPPMETLLAAVVQAWKALTAAATACAAGCILASLATALSYRPGPIQQFTTTVMLPLLPWQAGAPLTAAAAAVTAYPGSAQHRS
jgi:hypothetical protein